MPEDGGRVQYLPKTHRDVSWANRGGELAGEWSDAWGTDMVVPPVDAGTAAIHSYTTMHRGLASSVPGFCRPVLKLDYFASHVARNDNKDGWCEQNGFLLNKNFIPPVVSWLDLLDYWWPALALTIGALAAAFTAFAPGKTKRKQRLKPKRR